MLKNIINDFSGENYFLSNFSESKITYEGIEYPTVEHAFQAAKSLDKEERRYVASAEHPGIAKRIGRRIKLRPDWEDVKEQVMLDCVRAKFQIPELKEKLINTAPCELIEGNTWHDNCWGDCQCETCQEIEGKNLLGKILMKVRDELCQK